MRTPIYTVVESGCWMWAGRLGSDGVYGSWKGTSAHRAVFKFFGGHIPSGYEVDHLCRVPLCVNPEHLEPVTPEENRRRKYAAITECKNGHDYTPDNTYIRPSGQRDCRRCVSARVQRYKARTRSAA